MRDPETIAFRARPRRFSIPVLQGLMVLALLYTLYFARGLLIPIVVALLFTLLLTPSVTYFKRFHVPRTISAILLLALVAVPFTFLGIELIEPAQKWAARLPELSVRISEQLEAFDEAVTTATAEAQAERAIEAANGDETSDVFSWRGIFSFDEGPVPVADNGSTMNARMVQGAMELMIWLLGATPVFITQLLTFLVLTLFLLVFGSSLFDAFIAFSPHIQDKQRAENLVITIERELSRYILTVSLINAMLGLTVTGVLWVAGVEDPLLWGFVVGMLNYAPYVGPLIGLILLTIAGFAQYGLEIAATLPALIYFAINMVEAELITPLVLGRHMRLNPLILMVWLIIWGWLWGPVGVLLAVPLLVCIKLAAGQLHRQPYWVKLIEFKG